MKWVYAIIFLLTISGVSAFNESNATQALAHCETLDFQSRVECKVEYNVYNTTNPEQCRIFENTENCVQIMQLAKSCTNESRLECYRNISEMRFVDIPFENENLNEMNYRMLLLSDLQQKLITHQLNGKVSVSNAALLTEYIIALTHLIYLDFSQEIIEVQYANFKTSWSFLILE